MSYSILYNKLENTGEHNNEKQNSIISINQRINGGYSICAVPSKSIWGIYPDQQNGAFWKNLWIEILRDQIPVYIKAQVKFSKETYILGEKIKINTIYEIFKK